MPRSARFPGLACPRVSCRGAAVALVALAATAAGCAALPNPMAHAQEAAQDLNANVRYGRNSVALERVAPSARSEFIEHHRAWGSRVRIADLELESFVGKGAHDAEVIVRVGWFRPDESDLRSTTLKQTWHDQNGWLLVSEQRVEGDIGLLGEAVVYQGPQEARTPPAQFPSVRIEGEGRGP